MIKNPISQSIILSSLLFSSMYMNSICIKNINNMYIENKHVNYSPLIILNGSLFIGSSVMTIICFLKTFQLLKDM